MPIVEKPAQTPPPSPTPVDTPTTFVEPPAPQFTPTKSPNKLVFLIFVLIVLGIAIALGMKFADSTELPTQISQTGDTSELQDLMEQTQQYINESNDPNAPTSVPQGSTLPGSPLNAKPQAENGQTEQWQTYQNPTVRFSLSYPAGLQTKESSAGFGVNTVEFRNPANSAVPPEYQLLLMPKVLGKTVGQDFDKYYALGNNTATVINGPQGNSQRLTKLQNTTYGGQRAFTFQATAEPKQVGETPEVGAYIEMGTNVLIISTGQRNQGSLNEMLTTFKYPL